MMIVAKLKGEIRTDYSGIKKLHEFYFFCFDYSNTEISIDFYELQWIDANLCSLFDSVLFKLSSENGIKFSTDFEFLKQRFDVLFRNGFLTDEATPVIDVQKSCVMAKQFLREEKRGFNDYIKQNLMSHRGMPNLDDELKDQIFSGLIEIFANYNLHSNTTLPFFVAGQYYPRNAKLKFTMVDLGDGFLRKIQAYDGKINTHSDAIQWALTRGNSTKMAENVSGGLGISSIYEYCKRNKGELEIVTGSHYWSSTYSNTVFPLGRAITDQVFAGSLINLTFSTAGN